MYFVRLEAPLNVVGVEQAASLFAACHAPMQKLTQPEARAKLLSLAAAPDSVFCVGKEDGAIQALSLGVIEPHPEGKTLMLSALVIAAHRGGGGRGGELMRFTMRAAESSGAKALAITAPEHEDGQSFLDRFGFSPAPAGGLRRRPLRLKPRPA